MIKKKEDERVEVSLSIIDIKETAFKYNAEYDYSKLSRDFLGLGFNEKLNPNMDNNILGIEASVSYLDTRDETLLTELSVLINFSISNLDKLVEMKSKMIKLKNDNFIINLFNISIGTLRGVLYSKLKGTPLEGYPLPAISPDILKEFLSKTPSKKEIQKK
mgnify:CR=1 FL=1